MGISSAKLNLLVAGFVGTKAHYMTDHDGEITQIYVKD